MKLRIVELLLVTTVPTMIVAEGGLPSLWLIFATVLGGTLAAGGAHAFNMYIDRDIDALMERNQYRFQSLLYVVALDRHLRLRLRGYRRDAQLGDAIYLFLRAFGLGPGVGLWRHRFDDALVEAVGQALPAPETEVSA